MNSFVNHSALIKITATTQNYHSIDLCLAETFESGTMSKEYTPWYGAWSLGSPDLGVSIFWDCMNFGVEEAAVFVVGSDWEGLGEEMRQGRQLSWSQIGFLKLVVRRE